MKDRSDAQAHLLVVEDRDTLRRLWERALQQEGYRVTAVADVHSAITELETGTFAVVLTDLKLPDATGIDVLEATRQLAPATPVVVMTAFGDVSTAVAAMKLGAVEFLEKPVEIDDLSALVKRLVAQGGGDVAGPVHKIEGGPEIVGQHPTLLAALRLLERVSPLESTVLVRGESGTGKELFARGVHALSPRKKGPFVALNCAAIPATLIETELFGHEKGAFTGANRRKVGRFEQANGGTLFLDEIGELALEVQSKVLRVLEDKTFQRVGGSAVQTADVRLVAATNRDLEEMVEVGGFRADLFFRLDVFPIELPALRDRASDIPLLSEYLLAQLAAKHQREVLSLAPDACALLMEEEWPGNVRQLQNVLERAVILTRTGVLRSSDLEGILQPLAESSDKRLVEQALEEADGDKKKAAELLGVSYRTLLRRIKEHDLEGYPHYR